MGYIQVDVGLPETSGCSCMKNVNCTVKLRAVVALKGTLICWVRKRNVCLKVSHSLAFQVCGEGKGRERVLDRRGEIFYYFVFSSGMNWGREGINVERRLWE